MESTINSFNSYFNLADAYNTSHLAKEIISSLKKNLEMSKNINGQQIYIGVPTSDFSRVEIMIDEFDKFHNLWNFAEKWRYVN